MNHGVVYWPVTGKENTPVAQQLTDVSNALLGLGACRLFFTDGSYQYQWYVRGGNSKMPVLGVGKWFATVVSDEPLTTEQADALIAEFFTPEEEVNDGPTGSVDTGGDQERQEEVPAGSVSSENGGAEPSYVESAGQGLQSLTPDAP